MKNEGVYFNNGTVKKLSPKYHHSRYGFHAQRSNNITPEIPIEMRKEPSIYQMGAFIHATVLLNSNR
jgi:hypothetical protein